MYDQNFNVNDHCSFCLRKLASSQIYVSVWLTRKTKHVDVYILYMKYMYVCV